MKINMKLQTKITIMSCSVVLASLMISFLLVSSSIEKDVIDRTGEKFLNIAYLTSINPVVVEGLLGQRDKDGIQDLAMEIMEETQATFIVVADHELIRVSHPDPTKIGFKGVTEYEEFIESGEKGYFIDNLGATGVSLKAFYPVLDSDGDRIGVVAAGVVLPRVVIEIKDSQRILYYSTLFGLLFGIFASFLLARNIKRSMYNLEPIEIAKLLKERTALIHSVRDGIVATNKEGQIVLINEPAKEIFKSMEVEIDLIGSSITDLFPNINFQKLLETREPKFDYESTFYSTGILVNQIPIVAKEKTVGFLFTFRTKKEIVSFAEELTGVKNYVEALRSQVHEFTNKLHVIFGLVQADKYEKLETYLFELIHLKNREMDSISQKVLDPILSAFLLSKFDKAKEEGVELIIEDSTDFKISVSSDISHDLVTIIGNLLENAFDAVQEATMKKVSIELAYKTKTIFIKVWDSGLGIPEDIMGKIFDSEFTTKDDGLGIGLFLVKKAIKRNGGEIQFESRPNGGTEFNVTIPYDGGESL